MNQNKIDSMEAVGELVDDGNLLLQENGFPYVSQSDAWNEAGTKPDHPCLCETLIKDMKMFQYFDRTFKCFGTSKKDALAAKHIGSVFQHVKWREVKP